jgi:uncharacterized protein (TIGR02118 family)
VIKAIVLVARQDGISPEEFARHYREQHLRLLAKLPSVRRLVINHVLTDPNAPPPPYDIVA